MATGTCYDPNDVWEDIVDPDALNSEVYKKEKEWKKAIKSVLSGRDKQISSLKQQIADFQTQLDSTLQLLLSKEREISTLENSIKEIQLSLKNEKETNEVIVKRVTDDFTEKLKNKDDEIDQIKTSFSLAEDETRVRHIKTIQQIIKESKNQVDSLENELKLSRNVEIELKNKINNLKETIEDKISEIRSKETRMKESENEIKELQSRLSKAYNTEEKLIHTIKDYDIKFNELNDKNFSLLNNQEEKKKMFDKLLELNDNMNCISTKTAENVKGLLKLKDLVFELNQGNTDMKNMMVKLSNDFIPECETVGVQANINLTDISFEDTIIILKKRVAELTEHEIQLTSDLQKCKSLLHQSSEQNALLKGVIKSMKRDKEDYVKEKLMEEDAERIRRLEESVQILKSQISKENCGDGLWVVLNEMKNDLKGLKSKSWHKVTKVTPILREIRSNDSCNNTGGQLEEAVQFHPMVVPISTSMNKALPLQVPKQDELMLRSRQRRYNHGVTFSDNN